MIGTRTGSGLASVEAFSLVRTRPDADSTLFRGKVVRPKRFMAFVVVGVLIGSLAASCTVPSAPSSRGVAGGTSTTRPGADLSGFDFAAGPEAAQDPAAFTSSLTAGLGELGGVAVGLDPQRLAVVGAGAAVSDFLGLVDDVQATPYSVGYEVSGDLVPENSPGNLTLSIVHTTSKHKYTAMAGADIGFEMIIEGDDALQCQKTGRWTCRERKRPGQTQILGAHHFLYMLGLVADNPGAFDISEYTTEIIGVPVRCTKGVPAPTAPVNDVIEVCITAEGVPIQVSGPGIVLTGVWYEPFADDSEFARPTNVA